LNVPNPQKKSRGVKRRSTELRNPASRNLDRLATSKILRIMNREDQRVPDAVAREIPAIAKAVDAIVARMQQGGRLIYVGAGTSGRLAVLDAAECPPTFGVPRTLVRAVIAGGRTALTRSVEGAEDSAAAASRELRKLRLSARDTVVGVAASGSTPYVMAAIAFARKYGSLTIGLASNRDCPLRDAVDIAITPDTGPEVIAGSTRLKAGTAEKLVLNMLSTAVMVRLGHVYDNLMIDMTLSNRKLQDRSLYILAEASARPVSVAKDALRKSGHNLRTALVALKLGISTADARKKLGAARNNLRLALGETQAGKHSRKGSKLNRHG
jgi:N-acetylmuramic acid 6-phosphate etherase